MQVDGNDVLAVYHAISYALENARQGKGPSVVEAITYRIGNHTTVDDAKRYRSQDFVTTARLKDPIVRLRKLLESSGLWDDLKEKDLVTMCDGFVERAIEAYKTFPEDTPTAIFDFLHETLPDALTEERREVATRTEKGE